MTYYMVLKKRALKQNYLFLFGCSICDMRQIAISVKYYCSLR